MPLFFFDSRNGQLNVRDDLGLNLPDLAEAKRAAFKTLGDMARDLVMIEGTPFEVSVNVRDQSDRVLATASATFEMYETGAGVNAHRH